MLYEQIYFRIFGKEISNTIDNITEKVNNSFIAEAKTHYDNKEDILIQNNNSSKLFNFFNLEFPINDINFYKTKYYLPNENSNNPSCY